MAAKKKKFVVDVTLKNVVLSFPDLHSPKPYKNKITYKTDVLMDPTDPQWSLLKKKVKAAKIGMWGEDESEWPEQEHPILKDGNDRQDQKEYKGKKFITPRSDFPVAVLDPTGKKFNPQMVKGGMFAQVAIDICAYDNDNGQGVAIYLAGVLIDTETEALPFGGGKPVEERFGLKKRSAHDDDENDTDEEEQEDEDDQPRSKKKKAKPIYDEDEDNDHSNDEEDDTPPKSKKKKPAKNYDSDNED